MNFKRLKELDTKYHNFNAKTFLFLKDKLATYLNSTFNKRTKEVQPLKFNYLIENFGIRRSKIHTNIEITIL